MVLFVELNSREVACSWRTHVGHQHAFGMKCPVTLHGHCAANTRFTAGFLSVVVSMMY
jgi:hypothetical protein